MKLKYISALILLTVVASCKKVTEDDISGKHIVLISPDDQLHTTSSAQTFTWQAMDGADKYQLQIVRGTFSAITQYVLDTSTTAINCAASLLPGSYQWRVRGINGSTLSDYTVRTIVIQSNADISAQSVILSVPIDSAVINDTTINFRWRQLANADMYKFRVIKSSDSTVITENTIADTSFTYDFLNEGQYIWMVRAENTASFTSFSSRRFTVDH